MKLYHSANSPFVRKLMIVADELRLLDRIEIIPAKAELLVRDTALRALNPSGQIPTLVTDDGTALFDSNVICSYLDHIGGGRIIGQPPECWHYLRDAALADTMIDAALQVRYERGLRPESLRWDKWETAWLGKVEDALDTLEAQADSLAGRFDIGVISIFCALVYIDWRLETLRWAAKRPHLAAWFEKFLSLPVPARWLAAA